MEHGFVEVLSLESLVHPGSRSKELEGDGNQDISAAVTSGRLAQAGPPKAPRPRDLRPLQGTAGVEIVIVLVPVDSHQQTHDTAIRVLNDPRLHIAAIEASVEHPGQVMRRLDYEHLEVKANPLAPFVVREEP